MSTVKDYEEDIASLEHEIAQLNTQKADLMKVIEKIKKKKPLLANMTQLQSLLNKSQVLPPRDPPSPSNRLSKRMKRFQEEYVIPEPARHEYFDSSISKFFNESSTKHAETNSFASTQLSLSSSSDDKTRKINNILLENIYRMFGITAFPVSDPSKGTRRDLLGIRIEIFNQTILKFETPHYIILEKNEKTGKWNIFKHTIPVFIQLEKMAQEYDDLSDLELYNFCSRMRDILGKLSFKNQVVDKISEEWKKNMKNIEKDLAVETLKFKLKIHDTETMVILNLSLDSVESCLIEGGFSESEKYRIGNVLKGDLQSFDKRLRDVIRSLELS